MKIQFNITIENGKVTNFIFNKIQKKFIDSIVNKIQDLTNKNKTDSILILCNLLSLVGEDNENISFFHIYSLGLEKTSFAIEFNNRSSMYEVIENLIGN